MLWYRCFKQRLIKQEKEISIFFCTALLGFKYSKKQAWLYKNYIWKVLHKTTEHRQDCFKKRNVKRVPFFVPKKNLTDMKKRSWFYDFTYKCTSNIAWFTFWFWGVTNACGDTTKCTSVTFLCGNANVTRYYII